MNASKQSAAPAAAKQESSASAAPKVAGFAVLGQRFGNESLGRMLQTKLTVSGPQDRYEQEADRVADQVMRMADPDVRTQSQPISTVQRTEESGAGVPTVDASTESAIGSLAGRGNPLPNSVRSFMEPRFNADFSSVRVHTDDHAQGLARSVSAQAFTVGNNVVFGAGHYSPDTDRGKRLLAHELTHVVQQVPGRVSREPLEGLTRETEAALGLDKLDPIVERPPPLEHWLETGPLYAGGLTYTQVQGSIDEIEQFLGRQNGSSFKASRLEEALTLLRAELQRQEDATRQDKKKQKQKLKRSKAKGKAARPDRFPRILLEKTSVAYPNPADMRREYNLIMQWLAVPDLLRRDRQILEFERSNLKPQLDADRVRQSVERHSVRIRQALTPQAKGEADFLISLARTIQGIGKEPSNEAISYIYDRGEKVAIGTPQAADLRKRVGEALKHAARHIESNAGMENERYDLQKKIDHDAPVRAWIAGLLGGSEDPGEEVYDRYFRTLTLLRVVETNLQAGNFVQAASFLPRMEALGHEIKKLSKGFQDAQIKGAERAVTVLEVTRDVSFAIAGSIAAIVAAPVIAGAIGVGGVGGGILTAGGTGLLVGSGTAVVRSGSAALGSAAAGENLDDIKRVALSEGKRGFREGFISGAGGGLTRGLATALGVGSNVGFQTARRLAADSLANGMTSMVDALWQGKSIGEASEAALRGMLAGIPGSALGGVNNSAVRYALAPLAVGAANYVSAIQSGASVEEALKAATTAMATHAAVSGIKHDKVLDARLRQKGEAIGAGVRRAAGTAKRRVGDVVAAAAISFAEPLPRLPAGARETPALVAGSEGGGTAPPSSTPTPDPVEHVATTTPREAAPVENVRESATEAADLGSRTSQGTGDGGGAPPSIPPPPHTPPVNEAERLFQRLEQGIDPTLSPATLPGHQPAHPQGTFRRGMTTAEHAYQAYNEALAGSAGREVAIYYNHETGEFAISIGSEIAVGPPDFESVHWQALVHIHPDAHTVAQYRWPARQDFNYLQARRLGTNARVREFIEFDIPGVGRGRTEYGMDPAHPGNEYYMTIHRPDRPPETQRFESLDHFQVEREQRTIFVEKGSLQYQDLRSQLDRHWFNFVLPSRRWRGGGGGGSNGGGGDDFGFRTSSGTSDGRGTGKPAAESDPFGIGETLRATASQQGLPLPDPAAPLRPEDFAAPRAGEPSQLTQDATPSKSPTSPPDPDRTLDGPDSTGHTLSRGAPRDGPQPRVPVLEHPASDPVFTKQNFLGKGQNKSAFRVKRVVVLTPHDRERWAEINLQLSMLKDLRTLANGALAKYVVPSFGPFELQGRYVMVEPQLGEGSRSIVAPAQKGNGWFVKGPSKYLNQQSIDDIRAINALLKQHRIDIDDRQYLIDTDGHVYLADPGSVRNAEPHKSYDVQDDMLIEIAQQNISAKADTFKIGETLELTAGRPGIALPDPSAPLRPEDFPANDPFGIEDALRAPHVPGPGFRPNLTDPSKPLRPEDFADPNHRPPPAPEAPDAPVTEPTRPGEPENLPRVLWWDGKRWRR